MHTTESYIPLFTTTLLSGKVLETDLLMFEKQAGV